MCSLILVLFFVAFSRNVLESLCVPVERSEAKDERLSKAIEMLSYMNPDMDPCLDFYNFSCGNWPMEHPVNLSERYSIGTFEILADEFNMKIKMLLQSSEKSDDTVIDMKVKDFYKSCINFELVTEDEYREQLLEIVEEFGGMPAVKGDDWNETDFDWLETVAKIAHKYGKEIILGLEILPDIVMNTVNRITVEQPDFHLESRSMYVDEESAEYLQEYKESVANKFLIYLDSTEQCEQVADELVDLEAFLALGMYDEKLGLTLSDLSELTTARAMTQKYSPALNIEKLINITIGEAVDEPIYESIESYQRNLIDVLAVTPKHILANYIMYNLLNDFLGPVNYAGTELEDICVDKTRRFFAKNLDNMIYRRYDPDHVKAIERDINTIWQEIKQLFGEELRSDRLKWITPGTRRRAIEKLDEIKMKINNYEEENFIEEFADLRINENDYIGNIKNILELKSRRKIAKLHGKAEIDYSEEISFTAVYVLDRNLILIPVTLLQPNLMWGAAFPNALHFAIFGFLFGHELLHGFDDNGRNYNKDGNIIKWWDVDSSNAFDRRRQCFVDQYSQYTYGGHIMPKSPLQAENIADNGGIRLAYYSYLRWLQRTAHGNKDFDAAIDETMSTMKYNHKQLFFISYAQLWCNDLYHDQIKRLVADVHALGSLRVLGPLSNFPEFAKEFNCGKGTPMNRANERCEIY